MMFASLGPVGGRRNGRVDVDVGGGNEGVRGGTSTTTVWLPVCLCSCLSVCVLRSWMLNGLFFTLSASS